MRSSLHFKPRLGGYNRSVVCDAASGVVTLVEFVTIQAILGVRVGACLCAPHSSRVNAAVWSRRAENSIQT